MSTLDGTDDVATCAGCRGTAPRRGGGGMPVGWYGLTVAVPEWYDDSGESPPYRWVGVFCGSACLIAYGPEIARMEDLARQAYDPAPATASGRPRGRQEPRP